MSDLEEFRDHAREMAARTVDPRDRARPARLAYWCNKHYGLTEHVNCLEATCSCSCHPRSVPTPAERALWAQLADEIDAHLYPSAAGDEPLFEGAS